MKTTIDIPEELVAEAMKMTGSKTKTELIQTALKETTQKNKIISIKDCKGKQKLDVDLDVVRERNENFDR